MTEEIKKPPAPVSQNARNMIIGVITAVLVSGAVYLLGFNKKFGSTKLERQKATTEAWKSYVTIENSYAKATALLLRDMGQFNSFKELFEECVKESEKFLSGLQEIIKTEDLDKDMVAVLNRRVQNEETSMPRAKRFYDGLDELRQSAIENQWSAQQVNDSVALRFEKFNKQVQGVYDRSITDIEDLAKTLSERYEPTFNVDDFLIVQMIKYKKDIFSLIHDTKTDSIASKAVTREYIIGKWRAEQAVVSFTADGNWSWSAPNTEDAKGTFWEVKNGKLMMSVMEHPKKKDASEVWKWSFNISNVTENSFSMQMPAEGSYFYTLIRE